MTKAEIIWALNKIYTQVSARSASESSDLFATMFPDSTIAKNFNMHKDKLGYVISYGLGPYFENELVKIIRKTDIFAIAFDESLNKIAQKGQMDVIVRFWMDNMVHTRYLTSVFLGHAKALDLFEAFTNVFKDRSIKLKNMIQVSRDGPNVNKKFYNDLNTYLQESDDYPELVDFGTCILHIVHGSFKTAHNDIEWETNEFLRAAYYLFKDSPSRRADYLHFTNCKLFPLKWCEIRWLENSKVMERGLTVFDNLKIYFENT